MNKADCIDCHGKGIVIAHTGDGVEHQWDCPECNGTGQVSAAQHARQANCHEAFQAEQRKYGGSPL